MKGEAKRGRCFINRAEKNRSRKGARSKSLKRGESRWSGGVEDESASTSKRGPKERAKEAVVGEERSQSSLNEAGTALLRHTYAEAEPPYCLWMVKKNSPIAVWGARRLLAKTSGLFNAAKKT